jgi:transcriptional regulator with XRE-family HTH domain
MAIRSEKVLEIFKKELKNKKLKYEDLAVKLGMSLSGLKKSLASRDLSLARLQAICDVLDLSLVQVLTMADDSKVQDVYLTAEQESLLLRNPEVFHLYWKLRFEGMQLHQYIQNAKATREEVRNRLRKLEKVGLVKIDARGELEFSDRGMIRWNNYGPLVEHLNRKWSSELIDSILAKKDPAILLNLALLQLSEESYTQMKSDLRELLDRYSTQSQRDRLQSAQGKLKKIALLVAADEHQFVK